MFSYSKKSTLQILFLNKLLRTRYRIWPWKK